MPHCGVGVGSGGKVGRSGAGLVAVATTGRGFVLTTISMGGGGVQALKIVKASTHKRLMARLINKRLRHVMLLTLAIISLK